MRVATTWSELSRLTPARCDAIVASYLGWTLDAFVMVVVLKHIAEQSGTDVKASRFRRRPRIA